VTSGVAAEPVSVTVASPSISTTQEPGSATVGASISDTAMVSGGDSRSGLVTFELYYNSGASGRRCSPIPSRCRGGIATSAGRITLRWMLERRPRPDVRWRVVVRPDRRGAQSRWDAALHLGLEPVPHRALRLQREFGRGHDHRGGHTGWEAARPNYLVFGPDGRLYVSDDSEHIYSFNINS
jgi:hypothetical protein